MALALESRAMKDDILIGDTPKALKRRKRLKGVQTAGRLWKHSTLADIDGLVSTEALSDFRIFTLVRNPWDRMVSYYHWLRVQDFSHPAVGLARLLEFRDFVEHPQTRASLRAAPYGHYLRDRTGTERSALCIRLEDLARDIAPLEAHLGFALNDLPRINASAREADYRSYYTEKTAKIITDLCAPDIDRFGYAY